MDEGIVHFWRGINNFAWGIVDVEKGIAVVYQGAFHPVEGAEKPAEPAKDKGFAGPGFDESPGVAGAALRLATNACDEVEEGIFEVARSSLQDDSGTAEAGLTK